MFFLMMLFLGRAGVGGDVASGMSLTRAWTIGTDENQEETIFTPNTSLAVTGTGTVFVLDPGNFRVVVLDSKGQVQSVFGQKGMGPGEFSEPGAIGLELNGQPVVFDTGRKMKLTFGPDGTLIREVRFENEIQLVFDAAVFKNGHLVLSTLKTGPKFEMLYDLRFYDEKMTPSEPLLQVPLAPLDWSKMREPGFWVDFLTNRFQSLEAGIPVMAAISDDRMVFGRQSHFEGTIYSEDGAKVGQFKRDHEPHFYPEADRRAACEQVWQTVAANPAVANQLTQAVFEKALRSSKAQLLLPAMSKMCRLGEGFAVLTGYRPSAGVGQLDLFSKAGVWLGRTRIEGRIESISGQGNQLFTIGLDGEDRLIISKYLVEIKLR